MRLLLILLTVTSTLCYGQSDLAGKANAFLASLSEPLKAKAVYKFEDNERFNWHFVPKSRNGISFRDMNDQQSALVLELLKASTSAQGFGKATDIMALENVLKAVEKRGPEDNYRDPENYYITIFGTPGKNTAWGWRFEGHHVAINFSNVNNAIESSTPSFFGSNPGIVKEGSERGKQILKMETEKGFELINSMDEAQRAKAIFSGEALNDIVSFNSRKAMPVTPAGIAFPEMTSQQQKMLTELLKIYVDNYELGFSKKLMTKITRAGIDKLTFAWAGGLKEGLPYYYRIQGPMLLIELDNTQNNANHVHSVVRDLTNDFGEDILREHYAREHATKN